MVGSPGPSAPSPEEIRRLLLDSGAVKFGEFVLASGARSDVYVDVKLAWTDPARLSVLARGLAAHLRGRPTLAGMELGAVPLVVATALATGLPYVVVRKAAKSYGTAQRIEGRVRPGEAVTVLEDVATTGGSMVETIEVLRAAGARVEHAVVVVDREAGASERLRALGVELEALARLAGLREPPR